MVLSDFQMEADSPMAEGHLSNMGRMIEDMESKLRNGLDQVKNDISLSIKASVRL